MQNYHVTQQFHSRCPLGVSTNTNRFAPKACSQQRYSSWSKSRKNTVVPQLESEEIQCSGSRRRVISHRTNGSYCRADEPEGCCANGEQSRMLQTTCYTVPCINNAWNRQILGHRNRLIGCCLVLGEQANREQMLRTS